jgi:hypothetical protein
MFGRTLAFVAVSALLAAGLAGCGGAESESEPESQTADLSATSGNFSLSLNVLTSSGGTARIHGVANQPLTTAFAFIPDDQIGTTKLATKTFTSSFLKNELPLFLNGRPAFFSVTTASNLAFAARGDLGVKMHIASPIGIKVTSTAASVLVNGTPYIRVKGTFTDPLVAAKTSINGVDVDGTVNGKNWSFDYPLPFMGDAIANQNQIWILLTTKFDDFSGELDASLKMKAVNLTTGDPYAVWPAPTCTPAMLKCIQMPGNTVDTSACGDAFHVGPCWKQLH